MASRTPGLYTPELVEEIFEWVANGGFIKPFCRQPGKPSFTTVHKWIREKPEFREVMEIARQMGADAIADETLRIADTPLGENPTRECIQHRKLQVETRIKMLAKWHPQKYGDKVEVSGKVDHQHGFAEQLEAARERAIERSRAQTQH